MKTILEKVGEIVDSLNEEMIHRKTILKKYKLAHCILVKSQLLMNSLSIACGSSSAISLASGIGVGIGIGLSATTAVTARLGVFCNMLDQKVLSKIHKHYQLMLLARTLDLKLFQKYLYDEQVTEKDFQNIMDMMSKYFQQKDLLETKNLFVSSNISQLAEEYKKQLNGNNVNVY